MPFFTQDIKNVHACLQLYGSHRFREEFRESCSFQKTETKSHMIALKFIDLLTRQSGKRAGDSLESVTTEIGATRMPLPGDPKEREIVLIDTPGFDGTMKSDMEVLIMINEWLVKTYG